MGDLRTRYDTMKPIAITLFGDMGDKNLALVLSDPGNGSKGSRPSGPGFAFAP